MADNALVPKESELQWVTQSQRDELWKRQEIRMLRKLSVGEISFSLQMDKLVSVTTCSLDYLNYLLWVAFYFV